MVAPRVIAAASLALWGCSRSCEESAPAGASSAVQRPEAGPVATLPPSERVFAAVGGDGSCERILGGHGPGTWQATRDPDGRLVQRWQTSGESEVQQAVFGDFGRGPHWYVARGAGRSARGAALTLAELDAERGEPKELWRHAGDRNDAAHLSIADTDGDGRSELVLAYYADKYQVQVRRFVADGSSVEGEAQRMATSRLFADVDGDGKVDEVVGRIYGDEPKAPGDLSARLAIGRVAIPIDGGLRALLVVDAPPARVALYFSDGWAANYGRDARAQLKRAQWNGKGFDVELVGRSPDDYTFFELFALGAGGGGSTRIAARGSSWTTLFDVRGGEVPGTRVAQTGDALATAACRGADGRWVLWMPGADATRAVTLD